MQAFKTTYILELKRALNKKAMGLFLFISFLSLYFVQIGIGHYKGILQNKESFLHLERLKVKQYRNYNQFGTHGFEIFFMPSPLSIYFVSSSPIMELTAHIDASDQSNIYDSFKSKSLFIEKPGGFNDFSGILLLLGSLLMLYFGYEAFIHKDYLRFMSGFIDYKRFFFAIILSRVLIFIVFFLFMAGISIFLLGMNGIRLSGDEWLHGLVYLGVLILMMVFFFIVGTIGCSFRSNFTGLIMIIIVWFTLVYFVPGAVNAVIYQKNDNIIKDYLLELQMVNDYRGNGKKFKEVQELEQQFAVEINENIKGFHALSTFWPSTFYLSVAAEIGGKGYENFARFFEYTRALKLKFVSFYRVHRDNPDTSLANAGSVKSFIVNNENLFMARGLVPPHILQGVFMMSVYIMLLLALSYRRLKKSLKR